MDIILESKNVATQKRYSVISHWSDVTTGEVGSMVREAIKRGEQAIAEEAKQMVQHIRM